MTRLLPFLAIFFIGIAKPVELLKNEDTKYEGRMHVTKPGVTLSVCANERTGYWPQPCEIVDLQWKECKE